jgi:hypothetical protein
MPNRSQWWRDRLTDDYALVGGCIMVVLLAFLIWLTHPPAISIHLRPPKFRTQITLAVEHIQVAINSAQ